jgi:hypothetical protein
MNWNDYEAAWKRQPLPLGAEADVADLRTTFESKRRKLAATLQVRDWLESAAGLLVAAVFAFIAWHMGRDGWPVWLAIGLILGVSGFFLRERLRARRLRLGSEATLLAKLDADLAELQHQRRLLLNVWSWYLLPIAGAMGLFCFAAFRKMIREVPPGFIEKLWANPWLVAPILGYFLILLPLLFWLVWWLNRRAVRLNVEPRIAELEKLRAELTDVKGPAPAGPQVRK